MTASVDTILKALGRWQPGLAGLFQHARPRIALALSVADSAEAITAPGWVYDGARGAEVAHRWSREDEQDRVYILSEGAAYTVTVHLDGARTVAVGVPFHEALEAARAYMAEGTGSTRAPTSITLAAPPSSPSPPSATPMRPARSSLGTVVDAADGYVLPTGATLADEEETVLAMIRDGRAYKERYDSGTARKAMAPTHTYMETRLGRLSTSDLQRLVRAYARLPEEKIRAAQGWYALGASTLDTFHTLLARKRSTG